MKGYHGNRKALVIFAVVMFGVVTVFSYQVFASSASADETRVITIGTSKAGTTGYAAGVGIGASIKRRLKGFSVSAMPTPGTTASVKILGKGEMDMAYANPFTLRNAYNDRGAFAKKPIERKPLQGWYWATGDFGVMVYNPERTEINSVNDLAGRKVFPLSAGSGGYEIHRYVLTKMGIWKKIKQRQMGMRDCADALKMGTIDVLMGYSQTRGMLAPPYMRDIDARMKFKLVIPTHEEKEFIKGISGITAWELSNKWMRPANQLLNPAPFGWTVHYGFHPSTSIPTEIMYQIYKVLIEHAEEDLAPINANLRVYAKDPINFQVAGIEEGKDIPIHPGVAKYLKEKGVWKNHWIVGKLDPGVK